MEDKAARFDRLRDDAEKALTPLFSHYHKGWDRVNGMKRMGVHIKVLYHDMSLEADKEIASAEDNVKKQEMALNFLREKYLVHEDEIKNAVALLIRARRELEEKRNLWETERGVMKHWLNTLEDEQYGWPF